MVMEWYSIKRICAGGGILNLTGVLGVEAQPDDIDIGAGLHRVAGMKMMMLDGTDRARTPGDTSGKAKGVRGDK